MPRDNITPLHRVYPIRPTTAERRMVDVETAARAYGCEAFATLRDLDGPARHIVIDAAATVRGNAPHVSRPTGEAGASNLPTLTIDPPIRWWELSAMLLAAGVIGFALGVGL